MTTTPKIPLEDLPKEIQDQLLGDKPTPKRRSRKRPPALKEAKVQAVCQILQALSPFNLSQQKTILTFSGEMIEKANKRFWRD